MDIPQETLKLIKEFIDPLVQKPMTSLGDMLSDSIKYKQLQNQIRIFEKVKKLTEKHGLTIRNVKTNVMFDLLQGIGDVDEEDELLQDMWAKLFVNYIDSKSNLNITVYPSILKQLSTNEVQILKDSSNYDFEELFGNSKQKINAGRLEHKCELNNLERMGLMEAETTIITPKKTSISLSSVVSYTGYYTITSFGIDFIKACTIKKTN